MLALVWLAFQEATLDRVDAKKVAVFQESTGLNLGKFVAKVRTPGEDLYNLDYTGGRLLVGDQSKAVRNFTNHGAERNGQVPQNQRRQYGIALARSLGVPQSWLLKIEEFQSKTGPLTNFRFQSPQSTDWPVFGIRDRALLCVSFPTGTLQEFQMDGLIQLAKFKPLISSGVALTLASQEPRFEGKACCPVGVEAGRAARYSDFRGRRDTPVCANAAFQIITRTELDTSKVIGQCFDATTGQFLQTAHEPLVRGKPFRTAFDGDDALARSGAVRFLRMIGQVGVGEKELGQAWTCSSTSVQYEGSFGLVVAGLTTGRVFLFLNAAGGPPQKEQDIDGWSKAFSESLGHADWKRVWATPSSSSLQRVRLAPTVQEGPGLGNRLDVCIDAKTKRLHFFCCVDNLREPTAEASLMSEEAVKGVQDALSRDDASLRWFPKPLGKFLVGRTGGWISAKTFAQTWPEVETVKQRVYFVYPSLGTQTVGSTAIVVDAMTGKLIGD